MPSIISLVIQSSPTGKSEDKTLDNRPKTTTPGPESQTIFRTAGTLRSAEMRSCHPPQKFWRSVIRSCCRVERIPTARWTKLQNCALEYDSVALRNATAHTKDAETTYRVCPGACSVS